MKTQTKTKPIRMTKQLREILEVYGVTLRKTHTQVKHPTYDTVTDCDPTTFAVFQTVITTIYLLTAQLGPKSYCQWYEQIARDHGFTLPDPNTIGGLAFDLDQIRLDHDYCVDLIVKAGLYYELLD